MSPSRQRQQQERMQMNTSDGDSGEPSAETVLDRLLRAVFMAIRARFASEVAKNTIDQIARQILNEFKEFDGRGVGLCRTCDRSGSEARVHVAPPGPARRSCRGVARSAGRARAGRTRWVHAGRDYVCTHRRPTGHVDLVAGCRGRGHDRQAAYHTGSIRGVPRDRHRPSHRPRCEAPGCHTRRSGLSAPRR